MSAYTKVSMTFEVTFSQPWGEDCSVSQVRKQTKDAAENLASRIRNEIHRSGVSAQIRLVTINPNFTLVLPEEKL